MTMTMTTIMSITITVMLPSSRLPSNCLAIFAGLPLSNNCCSW